MKEPFKIIYEGQFEEIPRISASQLAGEPWNVYKNIKAPIPISDELNKIFDEGNETHHQDELLAEGSRGLIAKEERIEAIHDSKTFVLSGKFDYVKMYFNGLYLEDLKSTKPGALYFFLKNGVEDRYLIQLSVYAYLYYVKNGVYIPTGVITKINKENVLNRISLSAPLYSIAKTREFIFNHPTLNCIIGNIEEMDLIQKCHESLKLIDLEYGKGTKITPWICDNCQYKNVDGKLCEVLDYINLKKSEIVKGGKKK